MPRFAKKGATTFKLVHRNYNDPEYERDDQKMVLVRAEELWKAQAGTLFSEPPRSLDMLTQDDTLPHERKPGEEEEEREDGPDVFFDDAQWDEFDQDWIREMMMPGEDESLWGEDEPAPAPQHTAAELRPRTELDRQFEQELAKYDLGYGLEKDDPRTQGALDIGDYEGALREWHEDTKTYTFMNASSYPVDDLLETESVASTAATGVSSAVGGGSDAPPRRQQVRFQDGTTPQLQPTGEGAYRPVRLPPPDVLRELAFHADGQGVYLTTVTSSKLSNIYTEYAAGLRESNNLTKQVVHARPELADDNEEPLVEDPYANNPPRAPEFDVETVLSTYSNLENHPHLIKEAPLRIRVGKRGMPKVLGADDSTSAGTTNEGEPKPEGASDDDEETDSEEEHARETARLIELASHTSAGRPKGETAEERRERKELVKTARRMRREQKKGLKDAFKVEEWHQRHGLHRDIGQRRTIKLF